MKVGITYNPENLISRKIASWVIEFLKNKCELFIETNKREHFDIPYADLDKMDVDFIISIGGDGTILRTLMLSELPVFAINAGDVGFLSEVSSNEIDIYKILNIILEGNYIIDERMKIDVYLNNKFVGNVVNELVVHTSDVAKIRKYKIKINNEPVAMVKGDGIIISTSTGSTCYSMSAGGPIVDPTLNTMVIVPLNPFRTPSHPLVINSDNVVDIEIIDNIKRSDLVLDGQISVNIEPLSVVKAKRSEKTAKFIRIHTQFFRAVSEKLLLYSVIM